MQYSLSVIDKATGKERTIPISANNEDDARAKAEAKGMVVTLIVPRPDGVPIPKRPDLDEPGSLTNPTSAYASLVASAYVVNLLGIIVILDGVGLIVLGLFALLELLGGSDPSSGKTQVATELAGGIVLLAAGAGLRLFAQIGMVLRDIAIRLKNK